MPVGYPPYLYTSYFKKYIESNYALKVVIGPIDFFGIFPDWREFWHMEFSGVAWPPKSVMHDEETLKSHY